MRITSHKAQPIPWWGGMKITYRKHGDQAYRVYRNGTLIGTVAAEWRRSRGGNHWVAYTTRGEMVEWASTRREATRYLSVAVAA